MDAHFVFVALIMALSISLSVESCSNDEFECDNDRCIPDSERCDGHEDCRDGTSDEKDSDEKGCESLHPGFIVAIVIGQVLLTICCCGGPFCLVYLWKRCREAKTSSYHHRQVANAHTESFSSLGTTRAVAMEGLSSPATVFQTNPPSSAIVPATVIQTNPPSSAIVPATVIQTNPPSSAISPATVTPAEQPSSSTSAVTMSQTELLSSFFGSSRPQHVEMLISQPQAEQPSSSTSAAAMSQTELPNSFLGSPRPQRVEMLTPTPPPSYCDAFRYNNPESQIGYPQSEITLEADLPPPYPGHIPYSDSSNVYQ